MLGNLEYVNRPSAFGAANILSPYTLIAGSGELGCRSISSSLDDCYEQMSLVQCILRTGRYLSKSVYIPLNQKKHGRAITTDARSVEISLGTIVTILEQGATNNQQLRER
jgi:hypothetical protein